MKGTGGWGNRRSLGSYKEETTANGSGIIKDQSNIQNGNTNYKSKDESKEGEEINKSIMAKVNGQGNVDIEVHS